MNWNGKKSKSGHRAGQRGGHPAGGKTGGSGASSGTRRVEFLSASVIALIILYAGITALVESVTKILHLKTPNYTGVTLLIVVVSFDSPDRMETMKQVRRKVLQWMPDLKLRIRMDADLSD